MLSILHINRNIKNFNWTSVNVLITVGTSNKGNIMLDKTPNKTESKKYFVDLLNNAELSNRLVMVYVKQDNRYISMPKNHVIDFLDDVSEVEYFRADFIGCRGTVYLNKWSK